MSPLPIINAEGHVLLQWISQSGPFWAANSELYLQKYDFDGNPLWSEAAVATGPVIFPMGNWLQQSVPENLGGGYSAWTEMSGNVQSAVTQHINVDGELSWVGGIELSDNTNTFRMSPRLVVSEEAHL